jgi:ribonuclease T1
MVSSVHVADEKEPMRSHRHRWMYHGSLPVALLFVATLVSSTSLVDADTGYGQLFGNSAVGSPHRTDKASSFATAPQKVYDLLKQLEERGGTPLPGYVGGRDFQNRERRLPRGRYREYDVNPKRRDRGRDAERIVIDQRTGKAYYTEDHYRTFVPLN